MPDRNEYFVTGAADGTVGRAFAREHWRQGLRQSLITTVIRQRLEELSRRPVTIEVRVRDTPSSGSSYTPRSRMLPQDTIERRQV
jgi:hypothetical protein